MRVGDLEVQLKSKDKLLPEVNCHNIGGQTYVARITAPENVLEDIGVYLKDDTSLVKDFFDLRASITICVDGEVVYKTDKCILLQDISEYYCRCARPRKTPVQSGQYKTIEILYVRKHKSKRAILDLEKNVDSHESNLQHDGATLSLPDSTLADLKPLRISFICSSSSNVDSSRQNPQKSSEVHRTRIEKQARASMSKL